ncbi:hypothetical protein Kfla_2043 [Kribbella flavida DSM 17836]|uniref:Uncharacterized protein n=1 Tax=Kribbella flavida (strain DSM 17836 / JCM 10339 / NBRC 14399) TaxID=479435 RepID=D2PQZ9_KRIFD|nr:hypothetical protein [Kribbella flavida]ADB31132.1 hypothetical protein Kfla_2043 [Kribbella flavida DSM 17836]
MIGHQAAQQFLVLENGLLYVPAGTGAGSLAWLVDFLVIAVVACAGLAGISYVNVDSGLSDHRPAKRRTRPHPWPDEIAPQRGGGRTPKPLTKELSPSANGQGSADWSDTR